MPARFSPQLDPATILGVTSDATLEQLRDAYRAKAKKYHPDAGGDEWAFQILAKAYELMSVARVVLASNRDEPRPAATQSQPQHQPHSQPQAHPQTPPPPRPGVG